MTQILVKRSLVAAKAPAVTDIVSGELAINIPDGKLFLKKTVASVDTIIEVGAVKSVAGRTGDVVLAKGDVSLGSVDNTADVSKPVSTAMQAALDLKATLDSPALTGTPTAPTAIAGTSTAQLSTTQFVATAIAIAISNLINSAPGALDTLNELATALGDDPNFATTMANALALKAPSASPTLTGVPVAPTATAGTNTTQLATTAFVAALGALKANLAAPVFTGIPTAPTASPGTSSLQLATTAFVDAARALLQTSIDAKAPLASPALTGVPTVPTAAAATNTVQAASTAFVAAAIAALPAAPVSSVFGRVGAVALTQADIDAVQITLDGGSY